MTREEKAKKIEQLTNEIKNSSHIYLTDISNLNAEDTSLLRRTCFKKEIKLKVYKNTLIEQAFKEIGNEYDELKDVLKGNTSIMFSEQGSEPAKLIKEFRKKKDRPILKGAYVEEGVYIGDNQLEALTQIKSKNELIGDIVLLLQSPMKKVVSSLQSGGNKISGILETLSKKEE